MGQRDIRRLLITGAMAVLRAARHTPPAEGSWLARMLARKPRMLVAVALANKMARHLGDAHQEGGFPGSGGDDGLTATVGRSSLRSVGGARRSTDSKGKGSNDHGRGNHGLSKSFELATLI